MGDFVGMCLTGQHEEEEEEEEVETAATAAEQQPGKGGEPKRKGGGGGGGGGRGRPAFRVQSVDPSLLAVPGFVTGDIYTPKFLALQCIELFGKT